MITRYFEEGSLDNDALEIKRAGRMVRQCCCRYPHNCGDHCPMFVGPLLETDLSAEVSSALSIPRGSIVIQLCEATLVFQKFEDKRSNKNENQNQLCK